MRKFITSKLTAKPLQKPVDPVDPIITSKIVPPGPPQIKPFDLQVQANNDVIKVPPITVPGLFTEWSRPAVEGNILTNDKLTPGAKLSSLNYDGKMYSFSQPSGSDANGKFLLIDTARGELKIHQSGAYTYSIDKDYNQTEGIEKIGYVLSGPNNGSRGEINIEIGAVTHAPDTILIKPPIIVDPQHIIDGRGELGPPVDRNGDPIHINPQDIPDEWKGELGPPVDRNGDPIHINPQDIPDEWKGELGPPVDRNGDPIHGHPLGIEDEWKGELGLQMLPVHFDDITVSDPTRFDSEQLEHINVDPQYIVDGLGELGPLVFIERPENFGDVTVSDPKRFDGEQPEKVDSKANGDVWFGGGYLHVEQIDKPAPVFLGPPIHDHPQDIPDEWKGELGPPVHPIGIIDDVSVSDSRRFDGEQSEHMLPPDIFHYPAPITVDYVNELGQEELCHLTLTATPELTEDTTRTLIDLGSIKAVALVVSDLLPEHNSLDALLPPRAELPMANNHAPDIAIASNVDYALDHTILNDILNHKDSTV